MKKWAKNEYHNLFIVAGILNVFPSAAFEWNSWGSRIALLQHSSITTFEVIGIPKFELPKSTILGILDYVMYNGYYKSLDNSTSPAYNTLN